MRSSAVSHDVVVVVVAVVFS